MLDKYEIVLKNSTVLLAEDEQKVRESFKKVLLLYVNDVISASNGEEALALYESENPDIIITDIKMPKLNGLEFIKKVREKDRMIPIVVTSAYTDQDFLLESIKLSLVEYIVKPMKKRDLDRVLEECAKILIENSQKIIKLDKDSFYDFNNKILTYKSKKVDLTQKEVEFFEILLAHKGTLVTKQHLEEKLYVYEEAPPSALKNLVFKLRKKLSPELIKSKGKLGYIIE